LNREKVIDTCEAQHFSDTEKYCKVSKEQVSVYNKTQTKMIKTIKKDYNIRNHTAKRHLIVKEPKPSKVSIYIKDHKNKDDRGNYPTRIVVNTRSSPVYNLLSWSEKILHKYLDTIPFANADTTSFLSTLKCWNEKINNHTHKLIKADIKELYPSIPPESAIKRIIDHLRNNKKLEELLSELGITEERYVNDLTQATSKCIIKIGDQHYMQVKGAPIGSVLSGLMANFYMVPLIQKIGDLMDTIGGSYFRYVDDFLFLVPSTNQSSTLLEIINSYDDNLTFTIEEEGEVINYLQYTIDTKQNSAQLKWYRKEQCKMTFLH